MAAQKNSNKRSGSAGKPYSQRNPGSKSKHINHINPNHYTYLALPLYLIIALVPLIIYVKKFIVNDPGNLYWDGQSIRYDIFSYYKMVYLLIFTGAGLLLYLFMRRDNPFEKAKKLYYIPAGIFALLAFISATASEYKQVAFFGFLDRFEGAIVLVAYCAILFLAMNIFQDEKSIKILFGCLLASATVISILGVFQYFGANYFDSQFISSLITPASLKGGRIKPNILGNLVYSTLYNPNYVGSYMAMLIPILIILIVWLKKLWQKLTVLAILLFAVINLIGSGSRAGIAGTGFAVLVLLVISRKSIWTHKWIALSAVLVSVCGLAVLNFATNGSIIARLEYMATFEDKADTTETQQVLDKALVGLSDVRLDDKKLRLVTEKGTFIIETDNQTIRAIDENDKVIPMAVSNNNITFTDKRFENIKLNTRPDQGLMEVYYNDYHLLDVAFTQQGLQSPTNRWLTYRNGRDIEAFGFQGMESIGSNRGYIWSRTIPLLKNTVLIGHGPDTFAIYFPQYDFLNKLRFYQTGNIFVDKAHNMYLQTALNTGVLSLLAMLALFIIYFVSSIKIYLRSGSVWSGFLPAAGAACFTAFCGYAAAALFNDSVVSVAPVFWVLLGLGIGINVKLKNQTEL